MNNQLLNNAHRAYTSLSDALTDLQYSKPEEETIDRAIQRGYFTPEEDDTLWSLVSRYLTIRSGFWELIKEMSAYFSDDIENIKSLDDWRFFLIGYASCCQVVSMARLLIDNLAKHKLVQRKVNEGSEKNRIPRKVFTLIYESLSDADNAIKMQYMKNFVNSKRDYINSFESDEKVSTIVKSLSTLEASLHSSQKAFIKLRLGFLFHSIKRRFAVSKQNSSFFILEHAGRAISHLGDLENKRATPEIQQKARKILKPGDIIVTRHDFVASNLFLPGYWPHTALFIGEVEDRNNLDVELDESITNRWTDEINVLEAKKDGVLFRHISETLFVDEFVILRPELSDESLKIALSRVCRHEGKGYNFDFDFFRSDQLVCTEVIYRAFDNLEKIQFNLIERAGRFSLSAEDILDMAIEENGLKVVAAFGFEGCKKQVLTGDNVAKIVRNSYRK